MNRALILGVAIFFAVVGIALVGGENNAAVAGHGCACACDCYDDCGACHSYCDCACGGKRLGLLARLRARRACCNPCDCACPPTCCAPVKCCPPPCDPCGNGCHPADVSAEPTPSEPAPPAPPAPEARKAGHGFHTVSFRR